MQPKTTQTKQNDPPNSPKTHIGAKRPHLSFEPKLETPRRGIVRMWENTACTERPRAEGKRNRGLGKTWPCHSGWIAGPPLTGLPKIPQCCEPRGIILRPSWPWQTGSLPFTSGLPACTAILVGGTKRPTRPPAPMLATPGHHPLISFPHRWGLRVHGCPCRPGGARTVPPLFFLLCSLSHLVLTHTLGQCSGLIISKPF